MTRVGRDDHELIKTQVYYGFSSMMSTRRALPHSAHVEKCADHRHGQNTAASR